MQNPLILMANKPFGRPALEFEKATGFSGIAASYIFPEGVDLEVANAWVAERFLPFVTFHQNPIPFEVQFRNGEQLLFDPNAVAQLHALEALQKLVEDLVTRNPELGRLTFQRDSIADCYHVVLGAISGFNPDDIQYFLRDDRDRDAHSHQVEILEEKFKQDLGMDVKIRWTFSSATGEEILRQITEESHKRLTTQAVNLSHIETITGRRHLPHSFGPNRY